MEDLELILNAAVGVVSASSTFIAIHGFGDIKNGKDTFSARLMFPVYKLFHGIKNKTYKEVLVQKSQQAAVPISEHLTYNYHTDKMYFSDEFLSDIN